MSDQEEVILGTAVFDETMDRIPRSVHTRETSVQRLKRENAELVEELAQVRAALEVFRELADRYAERLGCRGDLENAPDA
jgi:hypothetical protein